MLIANGRIVTLGETNEIIEDGAVRVDGALITDVDTAGKLKEAYPDEKVVDAGGQLVMPGNICGHTHFYGAFARGMAIPGDPPRDFPEILAKLWWRLDRALTQEDVRYSALVCLVDAIKHGTTTLLTTMQAHRPFQAAWMRLRRLSMKLACEPASAMK